MKIILSTLALMLSGAYVTGCDGNDLEALQVQIDEDLDNLVAIEEAQSDDEDDESASSLETEKDLADSSDPTAMQTCAQWTPTTGQCERANIQCLDPEITPGPCAVLTQCYECDVPWSGGA